MLCGFICGWQYGLVVGFIVPLLRSVLFGMPALYPIAIGMAFELATYGFVTGFLYGRSRWKCVVALYRSMLIAMLVGRAVWGMASMVLLVIVPGLMVVFGRAKLVSFSKHHKKEEHCGSSIGEGAYSLHPRFVDMFDLAVIMELDEPTQHERIKKRNPDKYERFIREWIPMEQKYLEWLKSAHFKNDSYNSRNCNKDNGM